MSRDASLQLQVVELDHVSYAGGRGEGLQKNGVMDTTTSSKLSSIFFFHLVLPFKALFRMSACPPCPHPSTCRSVPPTFPLRTRTWSRSRMGPRRDAPSSERRQSWGEGGRCVGQREGNIVLLTTTDRGLINPPPSLSPPLSHLPCRRSTPGAPCAARSRPCRRRPRRRA